MANIQVKNIPEKLHRRLRQHAKKMNVTLGDVIVDAVEKELQRQSFLERLSSRSTTPMPVSAASLLDAERADRESAL